ncbi:MAG: dihydrofolate reductase family protein [Aureispira sp.]
MSNKNIVFIATSLDGYIAGPNGELDWLNSVPNPEHQGTGFEELMEEIDALIMGRVTFETVCSFGGEWPYNKPVFVLSHSLKEIPKPLQSHVFLQKGSLKDVLQQIHQQGFHQLYIDGGQTVQSFLAEDLIDELRVTTLPILLGAGISLFGHLSHPLAFHHLKTVVYLDQLVQTHYQRKR